MEDGNLPPELLETNGASPAVNAPEIIESAVDGDVNQGLSDGLMTEMKTDGLDAAGPEDEEKQTPDILSGLGAPTPMETQIEDAVPASAGLTTEIEGDVEDITTKGPPLTDSTGNGTGASADAVTEGEAAGANPEQLESTSNDQANDEAVPMAVEGELESSTSDENGVEKDASGHGEVVHYLKGEKVGRVEDGEENGEEKEVILGTEDEGVMEHVADQSAEVERRDAEPLVIQKIEAEEDNGDNQPVTDPSSEAKLETGEENGDKLPATGPSSEVKSAAGEENGDKQPLTDQRSEGKPEAEEDTVNKQPLPDPSSEGILEAEENGAKQSMTDPSSEVILEAEKQNLDKQPVTDPTSEGILEAEEENGDKQPMTEPSSDGHSEAGEDEDADDALDTSPPSPKRHKSEGSSVASRAAKRRTDPSKPPRNPERVELLEKMSTLDDMKKLVAEHGRSEADYKVGDIIEVDDLMQTGYEYKLEEPVGKNFAEGFSPAFSPKEMLAYGIFEGKVINDCIFELPKEWYEGAIEKGKLSPEGPDDSKNYFKVKSRLPAKEWRKRGWLPKEDPHGWFQWYCRYYLGRRLEPDDTHQMSRWRQLRRHAGQIKKNCQPGDLSCRVKQRQTLLNWSHDCFV